MSSGGSATIYDGFSSSPVGLERIVPIRWMLSLPAWARTRIAGAAWQWLGLCRWARRLRGLRLWGVPPRPACRHSEARGVGSRMARSSDPAGRHSGIGCPGTLLLCTILRIGGTARVVITFLQTGALYLGAAWLSIDRRRPPRRSHRGIGASAATLPGQPAGQTRHALRRHCDCHRLLDPRILRAGLPDLFGVGGTGRRRFGRGGTASPTSSARC
jgi:hypothetical protein